MVMQTQIAPEFAQLLQSLSMPGGWADTTAYGIGNLNPQQIAQAFQQGSQNRQAGMRDQLAERQQNLDWGRAGLGYEAAMAPVDWARERFPEEQALKREEIGAKRDIGAMKAGFDWQKLGIEEAGKDRRASMRSDDTNTKLEQLKTQYELRDKMRMLQGIKEPTDKELQPIAAMLFKESQKNPDKAMRLTREGAQRAAYDEYYKMHLTGRMGMFQQMGMMPGGGQQQPQGPPTPQQGPPVAPEIEQPPAPSLWRPGSPLDFLANRQNQTRTLPMAPEDML